MYFTVHNFNFGSNECIQVRQRNNFTWLIPAVVMLCCITTVLAMVEQFEGFCLLYNKLLGKRWKVSYTISNHSSHRFHFNKNC
jgi:hypothetical protein